MSLIKFGCYILTVPRTKIMMLLIALPSAFWWYCHCQSLRGTSLPDYQLQIQPARRFAAVHLGYLQTIVDRPLARSMAETLPHVKITRPWRTKSRFASRTSSFRFSSIVCVLFGRFPASASSERVGFGSRRNENVCFCFQDYSFTVLPALCFMARLRFYPAIRFPVDRRCRRGNHLFRAEVAARTVSAAGGELPVRCAEVRQTYYFLFL